MMTPTRAASAWALAGLLLVTACGSGDAPPATTTSAKAQVGERIYSDRFLSGSGRMSCATCHDPAFDHGPPNAMPVQVGGQFEDHFGQRAAPSLRYLERQPAFDTTTRHGGLMADGRADTLAQQALLPWFNALELDNGDAATLARKLRGAPYLAQFRAVFGEPADDATTVRQMAEALQAFQQEDPRFHPYDSKFDAVAAGRDRFSAAEQRGLAVFEDPARGNCAACHPSRPAPGGDGRPPLFTDFGYAATGVPRNPHIPSNDDPAYFDLGLCGPLRSDRPDPAGCGLFRTPGLRNVAQRPVYFHNGVMTSLLDVVRFYNTRDTQPERWYPLVGGVPQVFDDLPPAYRGNVTPTPPLDGRAPGSAPAMNDGEVNDLVCFLRTLSDGHVAGTPPQADCRG